ncbi:unnamed protein product, partial [Ectocarpus fasciculatus]
GSRRTVTNTVSRSVRGNVLEVLRSSSFLLRNIPQQAPSRVWHEEQGGGPQLHTAAVVSRISVFGREPEEGATALDHTLKCAAAYPVSNPVGLWHTPQLVVVHLVCRR